jgi:methyl-accepting chemotaxis protein
MTEAAATFQTTAAVPSSADGTPRREATTRVHETVQHAAQSVGRLADTATTLETDTRNLAGKTKLLTERSMEVSTAVAGLHEVAAAANVLALNATIEASKIPTQGQGFTEITADLRRLADRADSAVATLAQLAASVQSDAAEAVRGIERQSQLVDRQLSLVADAHAALEQALGATADEVAAPSETAGAPAKRARAIHQALVYASEVMRRIHGASEHSLTKTAALLATVSELQAVLGRFHTTHEPSAHISASLVEIESDAAGANGRRS